MKIVYAGTPEFAVGPLKRILDAGYEVVGAIVQPDKPQGRKGTLTPPPVKTFAAASGIPVLQPARIRDEVDSVRALGGDLLMTCAYGQILSEEVLSLFSSGVWNIHAGLLPAYRGASPIQSCILRGETQTGISVMKTETGLDTGDVLLEERTEIGETETFGELSDRLSLLGGECAVRALALIEAGGYTLTPQNGEGVFVTRKIGKEQAAIDFSLPAKKIVDLVRGMNPAPVAYTCVGGLRINVFRAESVSFRAGGEKAKAGEVLSDSPKAGLIVACGVRNESGKTDDGGREAVKLTEVQAAGGKRMSGSDFLNGRKVKKGDVFSC